VSKKSYFGRSLQCASSIFVSRLISEKWHECRYLVANQTSKFTKIEIDRSDGCNRTDMGRVCVEGIQRRRGPSYSSGITLT